MGHRDPWGLGELPVKATARSNHRIAFPPRNYWLDRPNLKNRGFGGVEKRRSDFSLPVAIGEVFTAPPQSGLAWFCFLFPLIAPDMPISGIRRSEKAHGFAHGRLAVRSVRLTRPYTL